jgi:Helix-turn-helix
MSMRVFHGRQIAAARALANISTKELAEAAGVTARTIGRLEVDAPIDISPRRRRGHVSRATFDKIKDALAKRGVELVEETESTGAGARWTLPRARRGSAHR